MSGEQFVSASAQTFCTSATVDNLAATGTNLQWYSALTGPNLVSSTALATGTYYVSQSTNGCRSTRISSAVTIGICAANVGTFPYMDGGFEGQTGTRALAWIKDGENQLANVA